MPLLTNERVTFFIDGVGYHFQEGAGDTDRIHLIFEHYDLDQPEPQWLAALKD